MGSKKTKTPSGKSATGTINSTSDSKKSNGLDPREDKRNFYILYRDGLRINDLTFDESWEKFTEVLGSNNPCSVFRQHEEMRVDH